MNLSHLRLVQVSDEMIRETEAALRDAGASGYELFVLWTGQIDDDVLTIEHCWIPAQESYKLEEGLCVRIDADELDRLNRWLYTEKQILGVQIHAHPTDAFHSETDDFYPVVTSVGGLSIVVPDFCRRGLSDTETKVYRLASDGWMELDPGDMRLLLPDLVGA